MKRLIDRAGWSLAGALGIVLVLVAARAIQAGPLDPPGSPASTMHTLDDSPVVWDRALAANDGANSCHSSRFLCVLPTAGTPTGEAVLDRETGLVWQRTPPSGIEPWLSAVNDCMNAPLGGRFGWRLPRIEEYRSLLGSTGVLPTGHPFNNVFIGTFEHYWSASTTLGDPTYAYNVRFDFAPVYEYGLKGADAHLWCVRGGAGLEGM